LNSVHIDHSLLDFHGIVKLVIIFIILYIGTKVKGNNGADELEK